MLNILKETGYRSLNFVFPEKTVPLHAMISSTGWQRETSPGYDWDGEKRGRAGFFLWQYTLSGAGRLEYEGKVSEITPGQAIFLYFPHRNRYWLPRESAHWEFIYICLYGKEMMRLLAEIHACTGPLIKHREDSEAVKTVFDIFLRGTRGGIDNPFECSRAAYSFAMRLGMELKKGRGKKEKPDFVCRVAEHCMKHLSETLTVDDMAEASGYSRYHFSRLFTEYQGISPAAFLKDMRLKEAARLLKTENLCVKEIAAKCGFEDCSYFCWAFRKTFGMSPEVFRKSGMY